MDIKFLPLKAIVFRMEMYTLLKKGEQLKGGNSVNATSSECSHGFNIL
jgi:hypothetical protein